jgi:hypothetical protein
MRKLLQKYLDRQEIDDDRLVESVNTAIQAMSDRKTLKITIGIFSLANLVVWIAVVLRPLDVLHAFETVNDLDNKIGAASLIFVFVVGMFLTYALLRWKFPDIEEQKLDGAILASFAYQSHSSERFLVWLFSTVGGVVNLLALVITELALTGN